MLFLNPLTCVVEGSFELPQPNLVPAALCLGPPLGVQGPGGGHVSPTTKGIPKVAGEEDAKCSSEPAATASATASVAAGEDQRAALLCVGTAEVVLSDCEPLHGSLHLLRISRVRKCLFLSPPCVLLRAPVPFY